MRLTLLETILAVAAAVLLILLVACGLRARSLNAKVAKQTADLALYAEAQKTNMATIGQLQAANAGWALSCRVDPGAQDAAVDALRSEVARLERELALSRNDREVIYVRSPEAREWADAPVPAGVADQLWPDGGPD